MPRTSSSDANGHRRKSLLPRTLVLLSLFAAVAALFDTKLIQSTFRTSSRRTDLGEDNDVTEESQLQAATRIEQNKLSLDSGLLNAKKEKSRAEPKEATSEPDMIHFVFTRFMQNQGKLTMLAHARMWLFKAFCLPTMLKQTAPSYYWIFKIDPDLDEGIRNELIELLKPSKHVFLIACNGQDTTTPDLLAAIHDQRVYAGDADRLQKILELRDAAHHPLYLESLLDADDGLHEYYLEYVQENARRRFRLSNDGVRRRRLQTEESHEVAANFTFSDGAYLSEDYSREDILEMIPASASEPPRRFYWCTRRHLKWHSATGLETEKLNETTMQERGVLIPVEKDDYCVTPGVTVGYGPDTPVGNVLDLKHVAMHRTLNETEACYDDTIGVYGNASTIKLETNATKAAEADPSLIPPAIILDARPCLEMIDVFPYGAFRSRTVTSAGMQSLFVNWLVFLWIEENPDEIDMLWEKTTLRFGIEEDMAATTLSYFADQKSAIAADNLAGQCTEGHSCKKHSQIALMKALKAESGAEKRATDAAAM